METEQIVQNNNQSLNMQGNGKLSSSFISPEIHSELNKNHIPYGNFVEEPIDLTCIQKRNTGEQNTEVKDVVLIQYHSEPESDSNNTQLNHFEVQNFQNGIMVNGPDIAKRRGRKRKYPMQNPQIFPKLMFSQLPLPPLDSDDMLRTTENPALVPAENDREAEVLKAAKSLFSKRTRTLFHWMYPNAPKAQIKAAIAASWETLGEQEKDFYISQVLGRFGFAQTNLMVNPQLGGILSHAPLDLNLANTEGNEETFTAVSSLLLSEDGNGSGSSWMHAGSSMSPNSSSYAQKTNRKRRRLGRPPGSRNKKGTKEELPILKQIRDDSATDEFQDDPELSKEFQQFTWALHVNDNNKS